jgi:methionyl-tRNA formyltransferase
MDKNLGSINFSNAELILGSANPKQTEFKLVLKNSAKNIHNLVRATYHWPGAYFMDGEQKIIILETRAAGSDSLNASPGAISSIDKVQSSFTVLCQEGSLEMIKLKPQGKNAMQALDWLNGKRLSAGDKI